MAQPPEIDYDRREAHFLFDEYFARGRRRSRWRQTQQDQATALVETFTQIARQEMGLEVFDLKRQEHELIVRVHDADVGAVADIKIDGHGDIFAGTAEGPNGLKKLPIAYSPVYQRLRGPRVDPPAGKFSWELEPRSPLAVLTEAVVEQLRRHGGQ